MRPGPSRSPQTSSKLTQRISARRTKRDLLAAALQRPFAIAADGTELFPSVNEKLAVTADHFVRRRPFPSDNRSIALAFTAITLEQCGAPGLSGRLTPSMVADLRAILQQLERDGDHRQLSSWLEPHVTKTHPSSPPRWEPHADPAIFVGHSMSRQRPSVRHQISKLGHHVRDAILDANAARAWSGSRRSIFRASGAWRMSTTETTNR